MSTKGNYCWCTPGWGVRDPRYWVDGCVEVYCFLDHISVCRDQQKMCKQIAAVKSQSLMGGTEEHFICQKKHKFTTELNASLRAPMKTIRRALHRDDIHGRAATAKPLLTLQNIKQRGQWGKDHKTWILEAWKHFIWSDESSFTIFPSSSCVYVWRLPDEAYNVYCINPLSSMVGVPVWFGVRYLAFFGFDSHPQR